MLKFFLVFKKIMQEKYEHQNIEKKWQDFWDKNRTFHTTVNVNKEKYYVLDMFPYPSGAGLHVGHPEGYTASDIVSRFKRMKGYNVLHPMGWDAFGLPAENYAIKTGTHPRETTENNIQIFKQQIKSLGFSYDWDREVNTTDPEYFKWTQWIFLKLFEKGLAYESNAPINFCPSCKTGLANEEVVDGKCDRCGAVTERKQIRQWILKITEYAERLLEDLELVDWTFAIKTMQRNWIGKSVGAEVDFEIDGLDEKITVFTTRPDTLFGATYFVLSPEHPLVKKITTKNQEEEVARYLKKISAKSDLERTELNKEKEGVFLGSYVINPVNGKKLLIYIADYVLMSYGTGAIMAVPAHDERDYEFANKYKLEIIDVVDGLEDRFSKTGGKLINSGFLNGLNIENAISKMIQYLEKEQIGKKKVNYKLRDWIFSRQRYWGEPIPLVHCKDCGIVPLSESELPLLLPEVKKYEPTGTGESPLAEISEWVNTTCPKCGKEAKRETNTMPQWAGSCWYYLRYIDNKNDAEAWSGKAEKYFLGEKGVDLYVGGAEHAVLHLLYARFWHKVLYDLGYVSQKEPFYCLKNQGMILGEDNEKMSKSRGNVINPTDVVNEFGADSLRLYEMFMGPFDAVKPWSTKGIQGVYRFLQKAWKVLAEKKIVTRKLTECELKLLHKTIKKVTFDTENFKFNTAISQMMIFVNELSDLETLPLDLVEDFIKCLSPYAPHIAEEIWESLGHKDTVSYEIWPKYDEEYCIDNEITIVVQVNGKLRGEFRTKNNSSKDEAITKAKRVPLVAKYLEEKTIMKEIYIQDKLVNFVIKE